MAAPEGFLSWAGRAATRPCSTLPVNCRATAAWRHETFCALNRVTQRVPGLLANAAQPVSRQQTDRRTDRPYVSRHRGGALYDRQAVHFHKRLGQPGLQRLALGDVITSFGVCHSVFLGCT